MTEVARAYKTPGGPPATTQVIVWTGLANQFVDVGELVLVVQLIFELLVDWSNL